MHADFNAHDFVADDENFATGFYRHALQIRSPRP
jgi:hypothetical protein